MTTTPAPVTGQDIGMAQNATRVLLDDLLANAGTDFEEWVILRMISQNGGQVGRVVLAETLAGALTLPAAPVERLIRRTAARGLIHQVVEGYALTNLGAERYVRLSDEVGQLTAKLYADFDPADLAITGRVLREVARKATALA
jgi:DNA-binding MarR family transcriptional regulator